MGVLATVGYLVASYTTTYGGSEWHALSAGIIKSATGTTVYTKAAELSIINMVPFTITGGVGTTDIVLIGSTKVSRIVFPGAGTVSEDFATLSTPVTSSTKYRPTTVFSGNLLIGNGNKIDSLTNLGVLSNVLTLKNDEFAVFLTTFGDQVIIITDKSAYFWDGISAQPNRYMPLE
jgi:hypothetical protein